MLTAINESNALPKPEKYLVSVAFRDLEHVQSFRSARKVGHFPNKALRFSLLHTYYVHLLNSVHPERVIPPPSPLLKFIPFNLVFVFPMSKLSQREREREGSVMFYVDCKTPFETCDFVFMK